MAKETSKHKKQSKKWLKTGQMKGKSSPGSRRLETSTSRKTDQTRGSRPTTIITPLKSNHIFLYGRHPVEAALKNKNRQCHRLILSEKSNKGLHELTKTRRDIEIITIDNKDFDIIFGEGVPHQAIALEVTPLTSPHIEDILQTDATHKNSRQKSLFLMLDQVSDPHNIGACMRSAAALGASGIITQDRHSPFEGAVLAKSASGALETLNWVRSHNLSQTLELLKEKGYWSIGLDGSAEHDLESLDFGDKVVLVMGSEGRGIRPLVKKHCDAIAKIPMTGLVESLNVSNAAAIGLYILSRK